MSYFSEAFKTLRKSLGYTQKKLSWHTDIPVRTMQDWECDLRLPPAWVQYLVLDKLRSLRREQIEKEKNTQNVFSDIFDLYN